MTYAYWKKKKKLVTSRINILRTFKNIIYQLNFLNFIKNTAYELFLINML